MKQVKIKKITKIEHNSNRYDIEVAKNSNFFANGVLVHNSSFGAYNHNGSVGVCSRNLEIDPVGDNPWAEQFRKMDLTKIENFRCIQGELVGPNMNGNRLELKERELRVFQVINTQTKGILDYEDFVDFCKKNNLTRCEEIPVPHDWKSFTVQDWIKFAQKVAKYGNKPGEGIVVRVKKGINAMHRGSHCGRLSFKVINPDYID